MPDAAAPTATLPPSLKGAAFLSDPAVAAIFAALGRGGDSVRAIGGAVRDAFLGRAVKEVDFATSAVPAVVEALAKAGRIKVVPTGLDHGTLTLVVAGRGFEVTTLREDILTDGRHAVVRFGRDWEADARRRDFTVNALSVDADGTVHDPVGGYPDILARRVRFIGDPDTRIAEDRLRLLRFFRFHAELGSGEPDPAGLSAAIRARRSLRDLPAERISREMRRLVAAPGAVETAAFMQDGGILPIVLGGIGYIGRLRKTVAFEAAAGLSAGVSRRLTALAARTVDDAERLAERLRLANTERDAMGAALRAARLLAEAPGKAEARRIRYRLGGDAFADGLAIAAAHGIGEIDRFLQSFESIRDWPVPTFPVRGADLIAAGVKRGPAVSAGLTELEDFWIARDFAPDRAALLAELARTGGA